MDLEHHSPTTETFTLDVRSSGLVLLLLLLTGDLLKTSLVLSLTRACRLHTLWTLYKLVVSPSDTKFRPHSSRDLRVLVHWLTIIQPFGDKYLYYAHT
jgi:hypothetical protein